MRKPEQNRNNYGVNPQNRGTGKGINRNNFNNNYDQYASGARNSEWNNTDEHFSFDHENNFDASFNDHTRPMRPSSRGYNANHNTDFSDEGLQSRSHRMQGQGTGQYRDDYRTGSYGEFNSSESMKSGHYGKGPKGYRRSDERIKEDVCEALFAHREIDASSIEVSVKDGCVSLSGSVESRELKRRIESEIEHLSGVDDVQNDIKVTKATMGNSTPMRNSKLA